ncbi:MAG: OmpA family protein [Nitrospira sp. CR1.2]|nr:OmpA family protein [Nitrospira sp. CR1.2]
MRRAVWALMVLSSFVTGCETVPPPQPPLPVASAADAKLVALQQEREQLLTTLGEFHDRIRDLESRLGDRQTQPASASYDQLLGAKEAELADLRRLAPERDRLSNQLATATNELLQARQRISALEQQLAAREQELAALHTRTAALADLDAARRRIVELETQVVHQEQNLRTARAGNTERDSLAAQLQTATATINSLKARVNALDHQLKEREQAYETVRSRLIERDKLVPQYNAMIAEIYQARHRIAALEQRLTDKSRDLSSRQRETSTATSPQGSETAATRNMVSPGQDSGRDGSPAQANASRTDARASSMAALRETLRKALPAEAEQKVFTVRQDGNRLVIALAGNWLFTAADAALTPEGITLLKRIGTVLGPLSDTFVQVAGHTDNLALSKALQKSYADNKALSWARADSARQAIVNGGMPPERIKAVGLADSRPVASNATEQGRRKNRRLELIIASRPTVASATGVLGAQLRLAALGSSH